MADKVVEQPWKEWYKPKVDAAKSQKSPTGVWVQPIASGNLKAPELVPSRVPANETRSQKANTAVEEKVGANINASRFSN